MYARGVAKSLNMKNVKNNDIVSSEESDIADYLKRRNLKYTNEISEPVKPRRSLYTAMGKRMADIIITAPIVVILSPVYLILFICIRISMGSPVIYKQTRTGKDGRSFELLKFRSMSDKRNDDGELLPVSERLTRLGFFIRKFSLDEIPSFINILRGDMSIIGPRPFPVFFEDRMSERHKMRSAVRPGLECPRVIEVEGELYNKQLENDVWYVENISFATDIKQVGRLIKMVFSFKKRARNAAGGENFVGYDDDGKALYTGVAKRKYDMCIKLKFIR